MNARIWLAASVLVGAAGLAASCRSAAVIEPDAEASSQVLELAVGGSARIASADVTIVFERVESDSRCPTGVTCVWAGDGVVILRVGSPAEAPASVTLHTDESGGREARHAGLLIRLVELIPHPAGEVPIDPAAYRIRLVVSS